MKKAFPLVLVLFISFSLACQAGPADVQKSSPGGREVVVLLHGLGRNSRSMGKLETRLSSQGYAVINLDYPSLKWPIARLADESLAPEVEKINRSSAAKIHFVTHSLGGIIVRYYLKDHRLANLGRVVMLSPPNQGSELVDFMRQTRALWSFLGPAGLELGTDEDSLPQKLGPPKFELGVIAGNRTRNPLTSLILDGPDDGTVTVKSTQIIGLRDFIVLPCNHYSIMKSEEVIDQVLYFLEHGVFQHQPQTGENAGRGDDR